MKTKKTVQTETTVSTPVVTAVSSVVKNELGQLSPLEKTKSQMCFNESFYAYFTQRMIPNVRTDIPTIRVRINRGKIHLDYNPEWFNSLDYLERVSVMKHEVLHIVFKHMDFGSIFAGSLPPEYSDKQKRGIINIATDLAINSHIPTMPEGCVIPGQGMFEKYPLFLSSFEYLKLLQEEPEGSPIRELFDDYQFDVHDGDLDSAEDEETQEDSTAEKALFRAEIARAYQHGNQTLPIELRELVHKQFVSLLNWRQVLDRFVSSTMRADKYNTPRRLNRKYPYIHSGSTVQRRPNLAISIDQSGSVSDELLEKFYSHLTKLAGEVTFTVIPFDESVAVDKIHVWKKGERQKWKRVLQGGTNFDSPTKYVNETSGFDGHIVLTDLGAPFPKRSNVKRLWITDQEYIGNTGFINSAHAYGEQVIGV